MPIHDNVALLHDGVKNDAREIVVLLMSTSPLLIAIHGIMSEVAEHAIFLDGQANVHPLLALLHGELRIYVDRNLDIELPILQKNER